MRTLRALRRAALVVRDVVGALALPPVDDSLDDPAEGLRSAVRRGVVRRALAERVEARREQQWGAALWRVLAEQGQDAAGAVAGHADAVVGGEEG